MIGTRWKTNRINNGLPKGSYTLKADDGFLVVYSNNGTYSFQRRDPNGIRASLQYKPGTDKFEQTTPAEIISLRQYMGISEIPGLPQRLQPGLEAVLEKLKEGPTKTSKAKKSLA